MPGNADFWLYLGTLAVAYLTPGPDMVLVLQTGTLKRRAQALAVVIGLAVARTLHVFLAAMGLAALLRTAPWVFEIVRVVGAAYLIWLGFVIFRNRSPSPIALGMQAEHSGRSWLAAGRRGLLTNALNPKALLFCSVLLPQFIRPALGNVPGQFLLLGAILVATGLIFDLIFAGAAGVLGRSLGRHPVVQNLQRWVFGSLLIGFGAHLALSARPG